MAVIQRNIPMKIAMVKKDMSQRDLAEATGINRTHINMLINGKLRLSDEDEKKVADALDCKVKELFDPDIIYTKSEK